MFHVKPLGDGGFNWKENRLETMNQMAGGL